MKSSSHGWRGWQLVLLIVFCTIGISTAIHHLAAMLGLEADWWTMTCILPAGIASVWLASRAHAEAMLTREREHQEKAEAFAELRDHLAPYESRTSDEDRK